MDRDVNSRRSGVSSDHSSLRTKAWPQVLGLSTFLQHSTRLPLLSANTGRKPTLDGQLTSPGGD